MKKYFWILLLIPAWAHGLTVVSTASNKYMVENTTGTDTSGNFCYDFQTRPTCQARISNISISSGTLPPGSTNYIQNRSTLQSGAVFFVSSGTATAFNSAGITASTITASSATLTNITATNITATTATVTNLIANTLSLTSLTVTTITPTNIVGQTGAAASPAGDVGEVMISSSPPDTISITSNGGVSVGTVTLTAGCWEIKAAGGVEGTNAGTTISNVVISISKTANTVFSAASGLPQASTGEVGISQALSGFVVGNGGSYLLVTPDTHVCLSGSTTYYAVVRVTFAVSTADAYGGIYAYREK